MAATAFVRVRIALKKIAKNAKDLFEQLGIGCGNPTIQGNSSVPGGMPICWRIGA